METVTVFIFLGFKITADGDYSHEMKRPLLLGKKAMTKPERILKSRDITVPTKVRLLKTMVSPVVMCGCESCTVKKAEHQNTDNMHSVHFSKVMSLLFNMLPRLAIAFFPSSKCLLIAWLQLLSAVILELSQK